MGQGADWSLNLPQKPPAGAGAASGVRVTCQRRLSEKGVGGGGEWGVASTGPEV